MDKVEFRFQPPRSAPVRVIRVLLPPSLPQTSIADPYTQLKTDLIKGNDNQGLLPICGAGAGSQLNRLRPQGGPNLDPHSPVAQVGEGAARRLQSQSLRIGLPTADIVCREVTISLDAIEDAVSGEVVADAKLDRVAHMRAGVHVESELCTSR